MTSDTALDSITVLFSVRSWTLPLAHLERALDPVRPDSTTDLGEPARPAARLVARTSTWQLRVEEVPRDVDRPRDVWVKIEADPELERLFGRLEPVRDQLRALLEEDDVQATVSVFVQTTRWHFWVETSPENLRRIADLGARYVVDTYLWDEDDEED